MQNNTYQKYNVPVPRYTSYPTVPDWADDVNSTKEWAELVKKAFQIQRIHDFENGISIYIHLPYCESLCTYCGCNTRITVNHAVETPYILALLKEFDLYLALFGQKPTVREIHLGGGTPTFFSAENLQLLIQGILDKSTIHSQAAFAFEAHPGNTQVEHLKVLYALGFKRLSLGIQDFDEKVQKAINRKQSFEQVKSVVDLARQIGYESINFDIIYGLPYQTICSVQKTIQKVLELLPERIAYYSYAHVPWKHPGQRAYGESDLPNNEEKRNLYELGKSLLTTKGYHNIGMDHFALKNDELFHALKAKKLHRNFMGYVPFSSELLIGLGVSAISDISIAYGQNAKVVEQYLKEVNNGKLPIIKGHQMSEQDVISKKIINQIMCNHCLDWDELNAFSVDQKTEILQKINELKNDGLLEYNAQKITVTTDGQKFIRNIAAIFDYRISHQMNQNRFSSSI